MVLGEAIGDICQSCRAEGESEPRESRFAGGPEGSSWDFLFNAGSESRDSGDGSLTKRFMGSFNPSIDDVDARFVVV